jgi:outer membrane protein assembly factor BamD
VNYSRRLTLCITVLAATLLAGGCGRKHAAPAAGTSAEPDKVLYARATEDIKNGRYTSARLALQTLINTYPDSEFLALAKLGIADSYYKEGGMTGLKQSIIEYKDFITFFPFLDEAAYAQLQVAMAHYRQMEKPDRDHAEAVEAEAELQTFLERYPNSSLYAQAEQRLRETQEVLAEGNFSIARFYFVQGAYKAANARLIELTNRYPLYSQADKANWMLGQIYDRTKQSQFAIPYYTRIVKEYPLSSLAGDAKARLAQIGAPLPQPDPSAVARMQQEREAARERPGMLRRSLGILKTGPDVSAAARSGTPTMTPPGDINDAGNESLTVGTPPALGAGDGAITGNTATIEKVTPGSAPPSAQPAAGATTPSAAENSAEAPAGASTADPDPSQPAKDTATAPPADKSQESANKKKKGMRKLIPW